MKLPLRILHLEDSPMDAELVRDMLACEGITGEVERVETRNSFVAALEKGGFDIILADHNLPSFDGTAALALARAKCPEVPFIVLSGSLGEELAIDTLKSGATDYVVKQRLTRLAPAVRRAVHESEARAERKRLEAQFVEAQKMEVVGHLAGGVAHDFNNVLGVILGYTDLIMGKLGPDHPLRQHAEEIQHAADRAAGLTRQLLAFSRKQTLQPIVLDLNETLAGMDKMLCRLIDENIELTIVPAKDLGRIKADPGYVTQVLMNLVLNARDAMPNGGKLTIETNHVALDETYARTHAGVAAGDYVVLAVSDTGIGMSDEVRARIFEAFFTTKPKGKGTGLGLATCQVIVKQCGGHIDVYSKLGKGTMFKVYFPRVDQPLAISARVVKPGLVSRGTETLLMVEDDPSLRGLANTVLRSQGYTVLSASNGQEGLRVVREHKGVPLGLVITDVIMPEMNGKEMAESLKTIHPHLKVLFTSGYTDDAISHHGVLDAGVEFLAKPYTPATLSSKVRGMLDN